MNQQELHNLYTKMTEKSLELNIQIGALLNELIEREVARFKVQFEFGQELLRQLGEIEPSVNITLYNGYLRVLVVTPGCKVTPQCRIVDDEVCFFISVELEDKSIYNTVFGKSQVLSYFKLTEEQKEIIHNFFALTEEHEKIDRLLVREYAENMGLFEGYENTHYPY